MEWFALIVLIVMALVAVGVAVFLASTPGKVAHARNHPKADAVAMCGWWGLITAGILLPIAWVWAYSVPEIKSDEESKE